MPSRHAGGDDSSSDEEPPLDLTRAASASSVSSASGAAAPRPLSAPSAAASSRRSSLRSAAASIGQSAGAALVAAPAGVAGGGAAVVQPPLVAADAAGGAADAADAAEPALNLRDPPNRIRRIERVGIFRFGSQIFVIDSHADLALDEFEGELHGHMTPVTASLSPSVNRAHWAVTQQLPENHDYLKSIIFLGIVGVDLDDNSCLVRATRHGVLCARFDSSELYTHCQILLVLDHKGSAKVVQDFAAFFSKRQRWAPHSAEVVDHALGLTA